MMNVRDKFNLYVEKKWWNGIEERNIVCWYKNFGGNSKIADTILDSVIFYNDDQLKAYTRALVSKLYEKVYIDAKEESSYGKIEDIDLFKRWNRFVEKTAFMPAAKDTDPSSSAYKVLPYWRSLIPGKDKHITTYPHIENQYKDGVNRFVLLDDFSGTGKQMTDLLKEEILFWGKRVEIGNLPNEIEDISIIIAVYVIHEEAIRKIKDRYPWIEILYIDLIDNKYNFLSESAYMYERMTKKDANKIISEIRSYTEEIFSTSPDMNRLREYVLNIPIVFQHGCPNNALLLLHATTNKWNQLFKRGDEI